MSLYAELEDETYPINWPKNSPLRWSSLTQLEGNSIVEQINDRVLPSLKNVRAITSSDSLTTAMGTFRYFQAPPSLAKLAFNQIEKLEKLLVSMFNENTHSNIFVSAQIPSHLLRGELFNYIVQQLDDNNEQYTALPRSMTLSIIEMLQPEPENQILNLCCGNGNFLADAYVYINNHTNNYPNSDSDGIVFTGYDLDSLRVRIANVHLMQFGLYGDSLSLFNLCHFEIFQDDILSEQFKDRFPYKQKFPIIIAHLPIQHKINTATLSNSFENYNNSTVMFINRVISLLADNGRAAVIVPNSFLFSNDSESVACRKELITKLILEAVVSLPSENDIMPKSSLLLLHKPRKNSASPQINKRTLFYQIDQYNKHKNLVIQWKKETTSGKAGRCFWTKNGRYLMITAYKFQQSGNIVPSGSLPMINYKNKTIH